MSAPLPPLDPALAAPPERVPLGRIGRFRRTLAELHVRLRTEGEAPARQAAAIGVGLFIGCSPFYGFHFPLCVFAARVLRLSQLKTYLASNVSLPFIAPFLFYAEIEVGRFLRGAPPLALHPAQLRTMPLGRFGADLLLGALVVGTVLGLAGAFIAYRSAISARRHPELEALIDTASRRYLDCGMFAWEFVRGKLRHDPLYFGVVGRGLAAEGSDDEHGVVLDLGCGRGILFSLILAVHEIGARPPEWLPTPHGLRLIGFEGRPKIAAQAKKALGEKAEISTVDLATAELPRCRVALLLDVLHYLPAEVQENLLDRAAGALEPGGVLLLRDADAEGGGRFIATRLQERIGALARGDFRQRFHYRSAEAWRRLLEARGLATETAPLSEGTPYANVLVVGRKG
ncbi:MAG TPA: DUF2062 domain-containing protein [Thermoanaerobaculia bacterium]|jgi:uncharacterized protein (DUF2062 family)/SAM-dependent methyltransferase|nr:DUF2062 domain-containing protein [Thermoanaerobaculia bacterium]